MLINVRGCNGSGKSTTARYLLDRYGRDQKIEQLGWRKKGTRVVGYELPGSLVVAGNYEYYQMGGLDGFMPYMRMWTDLLPEFAEKYDFVVYEGVLISGNIGRPCELADRFGGAFAFMDTSDTECLRRIYARNGGKEIKLDPFYTLYNRLHKIRDRFIAEGRPVFDIHGGEDLDRILREQGWNPEAPA